MLSINYTSVRLTYTILCDEMYKSIQILLFADLNYKKKADNTIIKRKRTKPMYKTSHRKHEQHESHQKPEVTKYMYFTKTNIS
jgi:hypothetical protein